MRRYVELRRHTDNDGDRLTSAGITAAEELVRRLTATSYDRLVSSGAYRATQVLEIVAVGLELAVPVEVEPGLRSEREDDWRAAYQEANSGELAALRDADPDLVRADSAVLAAALGRVLDGLPDGGRALVVGHSPTSEAAVYGLTGEIIGPLDKGAGVLVQQDGDTYRVSPLD